MIINNMPSQNNNPYHTQKDTYIEWPVSLYDIIKNKITYVYQNFETTKENQDYEGTLSSLTDQQFFENCHNAYLSSKKVFVGNKRTSMCLNCGGTGYNQCQECYGAGEFYSEEICPACGGSGQEEIECPSCHGSGETEGMDIECSECSGSGYIHSVDEPCPYCDGRGYELHTCESCGGTGYIDITYSEECGNCGGTGFIFSECNDCNENGMIEETCPICGGTGEEAEGPCSNCSGSGIITTICPNCDGTKQIWEETCFACGGSGTMERVEEEQCLSCNGTGHESGETCSYCDGTGYATYTCDICEGTGHVINREECPSCGGAGYIPETCGECNGSGFVNVSQGPCKNCDGTGLIVCEECNGSGIITHDDFDNSTIFEYKEYGDSIIFSQELIKNNDIYYNILIQKYAPPNMTKIKIIIKSNEGKTKIDDPYRTPIEVNGEVERNIQLTIPYADLLRIYYNSRGNIYKFQYFGCKILDYPLTVNELYNLYGNITIKQYWNNGLYNSSSDIFTNQYIESEGCIKLDQAINYIANYYYDNNFVPNFFDLSYIPNAAFIKINNELAIIFSIEDSNSFSGSEIYVEKTVGSDNYKWLIENFKSATKKGTYLILLKPKAVYSSSMTKLDVNIQLTTANYQVDKSKQTIPKIKFNNYIEYFSVLAPKIFDIINNNKCLIMNNGEGIIRTFKQKEQNIFQSEIFTTLSNTGEGESLAYNILTITTEHQGQSNEYQKISFGLQPIDLDFTNNIPNAFSIFALQEEENMVFINFFEQIMAILSDGTHDNGTNGLELTLVSNKGISNDTINNITSEIFDDWYTSLPILYIQGNGRLIAMMPKTITIINSVYNGYYVYSGSLLVQEGLTVPQILDFDVYLGPRMMIKWKATPIPSNPELTINNVTNASQSHDILYIE